MIREVVGRWPVVASIFVIRPQEMLLNNHIKPYVHLI